MIQAVDLRILGPRQYELLQDTSVTVEVDGVRWRVTLLKGFIFNGANIPHFLWEEIGCPLDFPLESAVHDGLYGARLLNRRICDLILRALVISQGNSEEKADIIWAGVRAGGGKPYREALGNVAYYRQFVIVEPLNVVVDTQDMGYI